MISKPAESNGDWRGGV